jgi:hypothetical protein
MLEFIFMGITLVLLLIILCMSWAQMSSLSKQDTASAKTTNGWIFGLSILGFIGLSIFAGYYIYISRQLILKTAGKIVNKAGVYISKKTA